MTSSHPRPENSMERCARPHGIRVGKDERTRMATLRSPFEFARIRHSGARVYSPSFDASRPSAGIPTIGIILTWVTLSESN